MSRIESTALGAGLLFVLALSIGASSARAQSARGPGAGVRGLPAMGPSSRMMQAPGIEQPRRVARRMRAMLEQDPDAARPRTVLGMALATQGKCEEALEHLTRARLDGRAWLGEAAVSEGDCHRRQGDRAQAEAAYVEATVLSPDSVMAWFRLGRVQIEQGRSRDAWVSVEQLEQLEKGENAAELLRLSIAVARQGGEALPEVRAAFDRLQRRARSARTALLLLEGRAWLAAGLPSAAADAFRDASTLDLQHLEAAWWRVEALRRSGQLDEARDIVGRQVLGADEGVVGAASRALLLVDLGDLQGAAAELAPFGHVTTVELLEARWYLDRAAGRDEDAAALEPLWRELVEDPHRTLDDLVFEP